MQNVSQEMCFFPAQTLYDSISAKLKEQIDGIKYKEQEEIIDFFLRNPNLAHSFLKIAGVYLLYPDTQGKSLSH